MIYIGIGNQCDLGIDNDELVLIKREASGRVVGVMKLGPATKQRIAFLQECLGRLDLHAVEEKAP